MQTKDFYYFLPKDRIAQERMRPFDHAKLMLLNRKKQSIEDSIFYRLIDHLNPSDVLVFNDTKVFKARLHGIKETGTSIEVLLLEPVLDTKFSYHCLIRGRTHEGNRISFSNGVLARVTKLYKNGDREISFEHCTDLAKKIDAIASFPLPTYISSQKDKDNYQTIYANDAKSESVAAPTAGFHFTHELLQAIKEKGITVKYVTLHVGIGTFRPVKVATIEEHDMHYEKYVIEEETFQYLNKAKQEGRRIIAVGTTSVRTLEDSANVEHQLEKLSNNTNIFIYPPYTFKFVDAMITNFHLPESTLLMLVSAFAGKDLTFKAYEHAMKENYRFYSFGDAMFIE